MISIFFKAPLCSRQVHRAVNDGVGDLEGAKRAMQPHARHEPFRDQANYGKSVAAAPTAPQDATASAPLKPVAVRPAVSQQALGAILLPTAQAPAPHLVVFLPPAMMGQLVWRDSLHDSSNLARSISCL
jgi:hypothetical protein